MSDARVSTDHLYQGEAIKVMVASTSLFERRAQRLVTLAQRVPEIRGFLIFMAELAQAQQEVFKFRHSEFAQEAHNFSLAIEHGVPPLTPAGLLDSLDWSDDLDAVLTALDSRLQAQGERFAVQRTLIDSLRGLNAVEREQLAAQVLQPVPVDECFRGMAPLIGASLQVAWTRQARALDPLPGHPLADVKGRCPCCGGAPVGSVVQAGINRTGARYLQCGLCGTQWYFERSRCSQCQGTAKLEYIGVEDEEGHRLLPVRAECCGECGAALKLVDREWDKDVEPLADDLGSLGLDALLVQEGYGRAAFNPLLSFANDD